MKLLRGYLAAFVACATSIGQAYADDKADFAKIVSNPAEQRQVLSAAKQSGVVINRPCPAADFTILNRFAIFIPLAFDGSGRLTQGMWKQSIAVKGCGEDRLLNVALWLEAGFSVRAMPLFPGTTRADPILQKDAMPHAAMAARWPEKDCKTGYMENTEFIGEKGQPLEGAKSKPWDELWTLASCTKKALVTMHFVPDKTGTTIHADLSETKFLPNNLAQ